MKATKCALYKYFDFARILLCSAKLFIIVVSWQLNLTRKKKTNERFQYHYNSKILIIPLFKQIIFQFLKQLKQIMPENSMRWKEKSLRIEESFKTFTVFMKISVMFPFIEKPGLYRSKAKYCQITYNFKWRNLRNCSQMRKFIFHGNLRACIRKS